ncbi:hypothetical protein OIV57_22945 [Burkholderia pseudomallei]|uniref:hypothetical protein n=1 Tax=Burkholderia pseudomallei TaxID=28450 RepID=UPI0021F7D748|nr:hypothetical protein [Burkholderia pseudomallei]MCV9914994.1 hypothetical protein [Burkholderia pseudomallei]MCW0071032.1 hypothetical protein [Burkholderia pseudomallei]
METICFELMKGLPVALATIAIAIAGGAISWSQYRVAKTTLNLNLFERRYRVFEMVWRFVSGIIAQGAPRPFDGESAEITNLLPQIEFLFGRDISLYVRELLNKATELWTIDQATQVSVDAMPPEHVERYKALRETFSYEASEGIKSRFGAYLSFDNWR